jgi:hypothetical protein
MDASDSGLVARTLGGDRAAFGALIERHRALAVALAARLLGSHAEAEDVAQEACLHAYLGLQHLRDAERFGAWLCGIALNLARMRLRARRAMVSLEDWDGGRVAPGFKLAEADLPPEAAVEIRELHARVQRAVEALPPEQRAAVRLHYLDGLTLEEIGVITGSPVGTIKARLHRARGKLREQLIHELNQHPERGGLLLAAQSKDGMQKEKAKMIEVMVDKVVMRVPKPAVEGREFDVMIPAPPPTQHVNAQMIFLQSTGPDMPMLAGALPHLGHRVVLLKERAGERVLPIWIGPAEADSIALQLAGAAMPRPLAHDLTLKLLDAAHATIERVAVSRLHEEVFYATISVRAGETVTEVDARPSDALGLALRANAPIFVAPAIMDSQGLTPNKVNEKLEAGMTQPPPVQWEWVPAPPPQVVQMPKRSAER